MFRVYVVAAICAGLIFIFFAQNRIYAQSLEELIVMPSKPDPVEVVKTSAGLMNCYKIKNGWFRGKWVTEHHICVFQDRRIRLAWVEEHWTCNQYDVPGVCLRWVKWSSGWDKILTDYRPYPLHLHRLHRSHIETYTYVDVEPYIDDDFTPPCGYYY